MIELTVKEQKAILRVYKDFTNFYNANSLSKTIGITQVGTMKILKRLSKANIMISKRIGKSLVYKINASDGLAQRVVGFVLANESRDNERWEAEFRQIHKLSKIVLFYGSASRNYSNSRDIDLMIIQDKDNMKETSKTLQEIQSLLPKKIHVIQATRDDLIKNLKNHNEAMIEIIKTAVVLHGEDYYMEVLNGFAGF